MAASKTRLPPQAQLDVRALELAAAVDGRQSRHEAECRDRYIATDKKLDSIVSILNRSAVAVIGLLLSVLGVVLKSMFHL